MVVQSIRRKITGYPLSTSIYLFGTDAPLGDLIRHHVKAGFKFLDFNFPDRQEALDSPFLSDA